MREYGPVHTLYKAVQKIARFFTYIFTETFQYEKLFFYSSVFRSSSAFAFQVSLIIIKIGNKFNKLRKGSKIQIALKYAL